MKIKIVLVAVFFAGFIIGSFIAWKFVSKVKELFQL